MPQLQRVSTGCDGENGAGRETRTPNRPITNRVLYQLSHASFHIQIRIALMVKMLQSNRNVPKLGYTWQFK